MRTSFFGIGPLIALFVACTPSYEEGASAFVPPADSSAQAEDPEYAADEQVADQAPAGPKQGDLRELSPEVA
ncbi:MAG: hypothetical protein ACPG77_18295, partial [Nannocystaceae bacterium]